MARPASGGSSGGGSGRPHSSRSSSLGSWDFAPLSDSDDGHGHGDSDSDIAVDIESGGDVLYSSHESDASAVSTAVSDVDTFRWSEDPAASTNDNDNIDEEEEVQYFWTRPAYEDTGPRRRRTSSSDSSIGHVEVYDRQSRRAMRIASGGRSATTMETVPAAVVPVRAPLASPSWSPASWTFTPPMSQESPYGRVAGLSGRKRYVPTTTATSTPPPQQSPLLQVVVRRHDSHDSTYSRSVDEDDDDG